jgi:magnesium transporter
MSLLTSDQTTVTLPTVSAPPPAAPLMRTIYRDGTGELHTELPVGRLEEAIADTKGLFWVDIQGSDGPENAIVDHWLRDLFHFHPLAVEDALQDTHLPKIDDWGDYLYLVFQVLYIEPGTDESVSVAELDIFLGANYLLTYHTQPLEIIEQERTSLLKDPRDRLRHGSDHLLYRILERAVDRALVVIEELDDSVDVIQDLVIKNPTPKALQRIFKIKRSAIRLHKSLAPQREVLNRLARDSYKPVTPDNRIYFRDLYDHTVRIHDISEGLRDLVAGTLDTYLSVMSNRTNQIMKTLTIVTVMFLPMSFLTSFFGMNFFGETLSFQSHLPKQLLFSVSCFIMLMSPVFIAVYAYRRKWL